MREDWIECKVSDVAEKVVVGFVGSSKPYYVDNGIPFLTGKNVRSWGLDLDYFDSVSRDFHEKNKKSQLRKNDVVVVRIGHSGTAAVVTDVLEEANCGGLIIVKQPKAVLPKYMALYFNSPSMKQWSVNESMGVTRMTLNTTKVSNAIINVPSYSEQRAIVTKIEELFSELDKGEKDLKKAQEQLKIYRQAVLKKAFEGKLTNTSMTLRTLDSLTSLITKGASPKWQGFDYTTDSNQILFVTSENVREGYISLEKEKYLPLGFNEVQKRSVLQKGDVLFNIVGASIGRAAIFELRKLSNINQAVALIRLDEEVLNQYVNYFLNSEGAKQEYLKKQVEVARANLSLQNVKDIEIPFCNIDQQRIVIKEIESRLSVCESIEASIHESLNKSKALRQSILKKAFEGTLLSEEEIAACKTAPDYEPASVLLERIKAEKKKN